MDQNAVDDDFQSRSAELGTRRRNRRGPPVGRHVAAIGVVVALMLVFWLVKRSDVTDAHHLWNVVLADASFVLLCVILMLGPIARLVPRVRRLVPWGRELGIGMFVTAALHVLILVDGHLSPELTLLSFQNLRDAFFGPHGFVAADDLWAAANWVGLFALGYAVVLAATSNDFSQQLLGRGWKFTQRQTYTLFVLTWLHAAVFLVDLDRFPPPLTWFWVFTMLVIAAQVTGFVHTVRSTRAPTPQRARPKTRVSRSDGLGVGARWVAVCALWGLLVLAVYPLGLV